MPGMDDLLCRYTRGFFIVCFLICAILSNITSYRCIMSRLKEPSTWAGIGLILTAITPVLPLAYATPVGALVGVCGGIAYILREGKTDAK